jgi:hypothetical protein
VLQQCWLSSWTFLLLFLPMQALLYPDRLLLLLVPLRLLLHSGTLLLMLLLLLQSLPWRHQPNCLLTRC